MYRSVGGASSTVRSIVFTNPCTVASGVRTSWQARETSLAKEVSSDTGVGHSTRVEDLQAAPPEVRLGLSRAGVTGVQKAGRIGRGRQEKLIAATIDCTVDLDPAQKGVHMSRFPELFEEAVESVVADDAFLVEDLAEHGAPHAARRAASCACARAGAWQRRATGGAGAAGGHGSRARTPAAGGRGTE